MRVHITDLKAGDRLAEDIYTSVGLTVFSKGATLYEKELSRLYQHQVDYVEIEWRPDRAAEETPKLLSSSNPALRPFYYDAVEGAEKLFQRALEEGKIYDEDVKGTFQPLVDNFRTERDVVSLLLLLNTQDDYTYQHSVQVGLLSYYAARWMGWAEEETVRAGKAGFLHDIGKCRIPKAILDKPDVLTDEEFAEIKNHTKYGYDILQNSFNDPALSWAALQHHERMDGSGYPLGLKRDNIHPLAKLISVADVYSAMISTRVYRGKRDLLMVLKEMYDMSFDKLDPDITHTFIRRMLPNFIGKRVELSNGESGTIILINQTDYFRPLIQIGEKFVDMSIQRNYEISNVVM
ncbi:HD family phosphohydrolase [Cohnella kolymensis]|uniref:HD family phosphohydrolase n=1 Tax=Cohnella kolymensis TaxID=1590652 RepID=A0ABR5A6X8_9BACL|nr:HD-GYP domain-containing protein [Cohnella kolymensis]KIL36769.1 HD family phosphohydrolase [Cohnella kolymensis]